MADAVLRRLEEWGIGDLSPVASTLGATSDKMGLRSYFVGGLVRDALLGRPSKDIDVCVAGDPQPMAIFAENILRRLPPVDYRRYEEEVKNIAAEDPTKPSTLPAFLRQCGGGVLLALSLYLDRKTDHAPVLYPRFLVAMTSIGGKPVEMVAARSEDYTSKEGEGSRNRNPGSVSVANEFEDARRRDFTVNALYLNLSTGELLDPTGQGRKDLINGIIRVVRPDDPSKVFTDDPLRIMRAIRQSCQLGFVIDDLTWDTIKNLMQTEGDELFSRISPERVRDELSKVLESSRVVGGLQKLKKSGVMDVILPEVSALASLDHVQGAHKDIWDHTLKVVNNVTLTPNIQQQIVETAQKAGLDPGELSKKILLRLRLGALLHDIGKVPTRNYGEIECPNCNQLTTVRDRRNPICENCHAQIILPKGSSLPRANFNTHEVESAKMTRDIMKRLKFDQQMTNWVEKDCALHQIWLTAEDFHQEPTFMDRDLSKANAPARQMPIEKVINLLADTNASEDIWGPLNVAVRLEGLIAADSSAHPEDQKGRVADFINRYNEIQKLRAEELEQIMLNKPLLGGDELMQMFGKKPGPWIGDIHQLLREDRLQNPDIHDKTRAEELARQYISDQEKPSQPLSE